MFTQSKKSQTGGLITGIILGIASLVIITIISFVIVQTLTDANLLTTGRSTGTQTNESGGYINGTTYQLANLDTWYVPGSISITAAHNATEGDGTLIESGNYTVGNTGIVSNLTVTTWADANFTYTYSIYTLEEKSTESISGNLSSGVDNVSSKIPTVLLVASIVFILSILVLLIATWQRMKMAGGEI